MSSSCSGNAIETIYFPQLFQNFILDFFSCSYPLVWQNKLVHELFLISVTFSAFRQNLHKLILLLLSGGYWLDWWSVSGFTGHVLLWLTGIFLLAIDASFLGFVIGSKSDIFIRFFDCLQLFDWLLLRLVILLLRFCCCGLDIARILCNVLVIGRVLLWLRVGAHIFDILYIVKTNLILI